MMRSAVAILILILLAVLLIMCIFLIVLDMIRSTLGSDEATPLNSRTIIGHYEQTLAASDFRGTEKNAGGGELSGA